MTTATSSSGAMSSRHLRAMCSMLFQQIPQARSLACPEGRARCVFTHGVFAAVRHPRFSKSIVLGQFGALTRCQSPVAFFESPDFDVDLTACAHLRIGPRADGRE